MHACDGVRALIARAADGGGRDERLDLHLRECAACRDALVAQEDVVRRLRERDPAVVGAGFVRRVAARIDAESRGGMLDLANWRAWSAGLVPVAAALAIAAFLGVGSAPPDAAATSEAGFDSWVTSASAGTPASVFLQTSDSADLLLETVLTGAVPSWTTDAAGERDVR